MHQHPPCLTASVSKSGSVRGLNSRIVYAVGTRFAMVDAVGRNEQGKQEGSRFEASWSTDYNMTIHPWTKGKPLDSRTDCVGRPVPPPQTRDLPRTEGSRNGRFGGVTRPALTPDSRSRTVWTASWCDAREDRMRGRLHFSS